MKINYRPEIDGLRAVAVISVILYHARLSAEGVVLFNGGFMGVDIFFVISGYLITSIIYNELKATGSFSFLNFYQRRIRRILPALIFVMIISVSLSWIYLLPTQLINFSKSILYSLGFSSNFYFHYSGQQYGAESGLLKPFLHTWSLSVEEQYYILFPIIFFIIFLYFRKYLIHISIFVFFISIGLSEWFSKTHTSFNFYFLPTRAWELLSGSLLVFFEEKKSKDSAINSFFMSLGFLLIGFSILFFNDSMRHPSFFTLIPVIGTCLIIHFSNRNSLVNKILTLKPVVGIGLISYSLYLWHYPLFAFARINGFLKDEIDNTALILIIIIILSILTFFFIERPARYKFYSFKKISSIIFISITLLFVINIFFISKNGYKERFPELIQNLLNDEKSWTLLLDQNLEKCFDKIEPCIFNKQQNKKIVLFGDSHAGSLSFDLKNRSYLKNFQFITIFNACFNFKNLDFVNSLNGKIHKYCNKKNWKIYETFFQNLKNSTVIISGRFPLYLSNFYFDNLEGGVEKTGENGIKSDYKWNANEISNLTKDFIYDLLKNENKIILVYPIPEVGFLVPEEIKKKYLGNYNFLKNQNMYLTTSYEVYKHRTKNAFKLFDNLVDSKIYRVYPHEVFCDTVIKNRCMTHDDKNSFYVDDDHLSVKGSEKVNNLIIKIIKKIEGRPN